MEMAWPLRQKREYFWRRDGPGFGLFPEKACDGLVKVFPWPLIGAIAVFFFSAFLAHLKP